MSDKKEFNHKLLLYGIALISTFQACFCILQFLGIIASRNPFFSVTGSYNNPNVIAIFLALTTPAFLVLFKTKYKKLLLFCFAIILSSLVLLKCRAAFIGTILSITVFYSLEYNFIKWLKDAKNRTSMKGLLIVSLIVIISLSSHLYNAKKESSDGRKFIWKVSSLMALDKPVMGYGYGNFEKNYNLYQAKYISEGKADSDEIKNAGPVIMPHNELLYNFVEGGIIGLFFMILFFWLLISALKVKRNINPQEIKPKIIDDSYFNAAYAGVIAFIGISLVNSTIQVTPIMILLIMYAGLINTFLNPIGFPSLLTISLDNRTNLVFIKSVLLVFSCYMLYHLFETGKAQRQNKIADLLQKEYKLKEAAHIMFGLNKQLNEDSNYWKNYGIINLKEGKYNEALDCFNKSKKGSSLPDLYLGSAACYEKMKMYPYAINEYKQLVMFLPSKFSYRFKLMNAYLNNKDTINAGITAKQILMLEPRIPSQKVKQYKSMAAHLLKELKVDDGTLKNQKSDQLLSFFLN
ncbi:O-antigen ligase family protein [Flavobacterium branchiicola]|uniref:O-antigen ligase family protein n=1 Tax=Flavobacterium branchiicola TaxID=1114875 RepID=A0ABV9PIH7_9FLAO|nr:O-antigen ligase family protein [Flavobacterium branchiicola]MBS7256361.1 O-antigen ligase family protein [Flavobacterium branchiicola]